MSTENPLPPDSLARLVNTDTQRIAARMAQEIFARTFRLALEPEPGNAQSVMEMAETRCRNWCQAGDGEDARALRLALLITGLDQWGLAYAQAFNLQAIPALSALIGRLRTSLEASAEARFQRYFQQMDEVEADAIDFKVEVRRNIHLALWAAMTACDSEEDARHILQALGNLMLALNGRLPTLGWRLLADALANIQMRLLAETSISALGQSMTRQLFESLRHALPAETYQTIMGHATQAVLDWQRGQRPAS